MATVHVISASLVTLFFNIFMGISVIEKKGGEKKRGGGGGKYDFESHFYCSHCCMHEFFLGSLEAVGFSCCCYGGYLLEKYFCNKL